LLTSATGGATLDYDPALRLYQVVGAATTRFGYDGVNAIAEYNGSNVLQRRYVFGTGADEALVQYEGAGTTDRRFMSADERGSIISLTDSAGTLLNINRYDEYGKPQSTNAGRFQYTGQMWLSDLGAYYYKARVYLPHLGIFAQADPVGYDGDGPNLYAYVLDDPVNFVDPLGLRTPQCPAGTTVCGERPSGPTAPPPGFLPGDFTPAILNPGPLNDPGVTCSPDCDVEVVITKKIKPGAGDAPWHVSGGRFVRNPLWVRPPYADAVDWGFGIVAVAPIVVIGGVEAVGVWGAEIVIGTRIRIAPTGNTGPGRFKWPHYHIRREGPGQGIKRHRPWETKESDTSWRDRF
jgi:RHS repeat-associated protein